MPRAVPAAVRRLAALACLLALTAPAAATASEAAKAPGRPSFAGRTLAEALDVLRDLGLEIVSSSALVRPEMTVSDEPVATAPEAILTEILAPHGLAVRVVGTGRHVVVPAATGAPRPGSIRGRVSAPGEDRLHSTVTIQLLETGDVVGADPAGAFELDGLEPGHYTIATSSPAFQPSTAEVLVTAGETTRVELQLLPRSVFLNEIVVTPSHFRILDDDPQSRLSLSRDEVDEMPHIADDLYRAVKRLPGASGGDISALFHVRGGANDEMLVVLDGVELIEPFHLKDFQNIFSTLDAEAVGGVEFLTGGFPVEYGDRMSGVMDISLATPTGPPRTSVGLGTLNSRLLSEGTFDDGRGSWLVSGRWWYPDAFLDALDATREDILTDYADLVATVGHTVGSRSTVALNLLVSDDDLGFRVTDIDETEEVAATSRNAHLWLTLKTHWSPSLYSRTIASTGRVSRDRTGGVEDLVEGTIDVTDDRVFQVAALKQDWTLELGDRQLLKWGFDLQHQRAEYDYLLRVTELDSGDERLEPGEAAVLLDRRGESYGLYAADRLRLSERLIAEVGLRWDKQFWIDDQQLSPRLNLRFDAGPATTLRAAWGRFHQTQRLYELPVEDGVDQFDQAQRAEHWLASVEHRFGGGLAFRLEGYLKQFDRLRPRYENLFNPIELFPEARDDRILIEPDGGRAAGVELLLKGRPDRRLTWWVSASASRSEDDIDGEWVPRAWDQRYAASFGLNLALPHRWNIHLAGAAHSGWPTTTATGVVVGDDDGEPDVEAQLGPRNRDRHPRYRRFDLRISKGFAVGPGMLTVIAEVINLTNRRNVCCVEDFSFNIRDDGTVETVPEYGYWAPLVPSLSVRWEF